MMLNFATRHRRTSFHLSQPGRHQMTPVDPGRLLVRRTARTGAHLGHDEAVGLGHEGVAPGAEGKVDVGAVQFNRVDVEAAGVHSLVFRDV